MRITISKWSISYSNDSQKCEWKVMNTEEAQRKKEGKKVQIENAKLVSWILLET